MDTYDKALEKIKQDQKYKPNYVMYMTPGITGPTGPTGPAGTSVSILGSYDTLDELQREHLTSNIGDGYLVGDNLYVWSQENEWHNVGRLRGPKGDQGPQGIAGIQGIPGPKGDQGVKGDIGPTGPQGKQGTQGPTGATGPAGTSVSILGSYDTLDELQREHLTNNIGDGYLVGDNLYVWSQENEWHNVGRLRGPKGDQGPQGIAGIQGIQGPKGDQGVKGDIGPTGPQGKQGIQGPTGATGPAGTSVSILGSYDTLDELKKAHQKGNTGEAYLVDSNLYVWSQENDDWIDVGIIKGPKGDQGVKGDIGPTGPQGKQGIQGPTGPTGSEKIGIVYLVTLNNNNTAGETIYPNHSIPITNKEVDNMDICSFNSNGMINLKKAGIYRIDFVVNVFVEPIDEFNPNIDIISIGFKNSFKKDIYVGNSSWITNKGSISIVGQGTFIVNDPVKDYLELVNLSKQPIVLNSPSLSYTSFQSNLANPLATILIQYLG